MENATTYLASDNNHEQMFIYSHGSGGKAERRSRAELLEKVPQSRVGLTVLTDTLPQRNYPDSGS